MLATEFLVRGAEEFGEPGVMVTFEETSHEIVENVRSLGVDLERLIEEKKMLLDYVRIERSEIEETGEYDLEGLFIRIGYAVDSIGAKRVVLDTLEALFAGLPNHAILRAELRRLFRWLKERGLTAVITGERGESQLTRFGLEEYVADCVILLDHRVDEQISTRRLRVVKYRGTEHGTNEYPFLIGKNGFSVLPVTSLGLNHETSNETVSTGIQELDEMLGAGGVYRGSSILITGGAGTGKSSLGATIACAACDRGEKAVLFAFEEAPSQIIRNMRSIGLDLGRHCDSGLLTIQSARPTLQGLEQHLVMMHDTVHNVKPSIVVIDPISNLTSEHSAIDVKPTLLRLIDFLKQDGITAVFTSLSTEVEKVDGTDLGVSSLMDTWLLLQNTESNGERNRTLYILKARGMAHSNQIREFILSDQGINLVEVYLGQDRVLTGSARLIQKEKEQSERLVNQMERERLQRQAITRRKVLESQIAALQAELESEASLLEHAREELNLFERIDQNAAKVMAASRGADRGNGDRETKTD